MACHDVQHEQVNCTGWEMIESFIGAMFISLICSPFLLLAVVLPFEEAMGKIAPNTPLSDRFLPYPAAVADVWLLWQVWRHVRNKWHPVAPQVARSLPRLHALLRWSAAVLWLFHFALCIHWSLLSTDMDLGFSTFEEGFASIVMPIVWHVGLAYAANLFLLLSLFALTLKESVLSFLWRRRWTVNVLIAVSTTIGSALFTDRLRGM